VRQKKEKTLGPALMPKLEAQSKLAEYIEEYTGRITKQGDSIACPPQKLRSPEIAFW
jgi:hypothetical protein